MSLKSHPSRRGFLRAAAGVGAGGAAAIAGVSAAGAAEPRPAAATTSDATTRKPVLVGANPGVQLFDADGACTAYASTWRVDWSVEGAGTAMVLWQPTSVTVVGDDEILARWLAEDFVRHFPELDGLTWHEPRYVSARVVIDLSLQTGLTARAGEIEVRLGDVLDVRSFATDEFALGGVPHSLHLVLGPCAFGEVRLAGRNLPGTIARGGTPERPSSSAFVTEAEVWRRAT